MDWIVGSILAIDGTYQPSKALVATTDQRLVPSQSGSGRVVSSRVSFLRSILRVSQD